MFENIINHFKKLGKKDELSEAKKNKDTAKERLHLVLMQDRANVSADFLDMMKQEIIDVIKKYIDVDENAIDVKLTNQQNSDGTTGAPALYANIPIISIKEETRKVNGKIEIEKSKEDNKKIEEKKSEKESNENNNDKEDNNKVLEEISENIEEATNTEKKEEISEKKEESSENSNKEQHNKNNQVAKTNNKKKNNKRKKK